MLEEVEHDVQADGRVIGQVWNRHGFWSGKAQDETHHNLESRKEGSPWKTQKSGLPDRRNPAAPWVGSMISP